MGKLFPEEMSEDNVICHFHRRHTKSKAIYVAIMIVVLLTIGALPLIYVDISTQSRGKIRSVYENNNLQSAIYGEIVETVLHENKIVTKGDTLIRLRTDELEQQIIRNIQKQNENSEFMGDLSSLIAGRYALLTSKYKTEAIQYQAQLNEKNISLSQSEKEYLISKQLNEKGVESDYEHSQTKAKYEVEKSQKQLLVQQQINIWQAEKTRIEYENRDLQSELLLLEKRKSQYVITAPMNGHIVQYNGLQVGNFLSPGEVIATISSADSLLVECYISPSDIGYIHTTQDVKLQMDAFDYQQWGLLDGKVVEIITDVVLLDNQPFFRIYCSMDKEYLELDNGYKGTLKKGMLSTARFYLTRRSLAQLLFDKIDNWINPKLIVENGNKG